MSFFSVTLFFTLACAPKINNPSGDCKTQGNGARPLYHSPDRDSTYLPDCNNELKRELWRVFALNESSAYIIPRPDAMGIQYGLCDGEDLQLAELFDEYGLCEDVGNPNVINDILPLDALTITHTLHQLLKFELDEDGLITPWAPDDDLIAACELTDSEDALNHCDLLESRCNTWGSCEDIGYIPNQRAAEALVSALNQLYGIP